MRRSESGFTLLEVLVATVVMAIAIAGVLSALSTSMRNQARLTDYDRSAMLARRKMDELLVDRKLPRFVEQQGVWDPVMTNGRQSGWSARVEPWEMLPNIGAGTSMLERVVLEVWWMEGERRRSVQIEGFRRGVLKPEDVQSVQSRNNATL